jgi:hypothetical protein
VNLKPSGSLSATPKASLFVAKAKVAANLSMSTQSCILAATAIFSKAITLSIAHFAYTHQSTHHSCTKTLNSKPKHDAIRFVTVGAQSTSP